MTGAASAEREDDAALVDALDASDRYLDDHERATKLLKQGFLKLAMARRHLPAHALGELSFHETFEALAVVSAPSGESQGWQLQRPESAELSMPTEASESLTRRKKPPPPPSHSSERETQQVGTREANDTILWFSSLPPNDLRQAQKLFTSGLRALLDTAASARQVQEAVRR